MRHPFDGIDSQPSALLEQVSSSGRVVLAGAILGILLSQSGCQMAPNAAFSLQRDDTFLSVILPSPNPDAASMLIYEPTVTTLAIGEEGGVVSSLNPPPAAVTTNTFGEEGGFGTLTITPKPPVNVTTDILGEEGGVSGSLTPSPPVVSSASWGEEGGSVHFPGPPIVVTTDIFGEEGGIGTLTITPIQPPGTATTDIVGEEGGVGWFQPNPPVLTTQAIGEEGGTGGTVLKAGTVTITPTKSAAVPMPKLLSVKPKGR